MTERDTMHEQLLVWGKYTNVFVVTETGSRDSLEKNIDSGAYGM